MAPEIIDVAKRTLGLPSPFGIRFWAQFGPAELRASTRRALVLRLRDARVTGPGRLGSN